MYFFSRKCPSNLTMYAPKLCIAFNLLCDRFSHFRRKTTIKQDEEKNTTYDLRVEQTLAVIFLLVKKT